MPICQEIAGSALGIDIIPCPIGTRRFLYDLFSNNIPCYWIIIKPVKSTLFVWKGDMHGHTRLKQTDQLFIHIFEFIRNMKTDKLLARKLMTELILQPADMLLLHSKNQICPADLACGHLNSGILFCAR